MRRRRRAPYASAALAFPLALGLLFNARAAFGQAPTDPNPQSGSSLPTGAAGAMVVPPKEEAAPAPKAPVLGPPEVVTDPGAAYPPQAVTDGVAEPVTVSVIVDLDRDGHVLSTSVPAPQGHGFDEAAIAAAKGLVFKPATRDGVPIPSRTKHAYVFTPPPARLVGRVLEAGGGPIAGASVTVRPGKNWPAGTTGPAPTPGKEQPRPEERVVTTGPDGRWSIEGLPGGTYDVEVAAPGFKPHESEETVHLGEEASTVDHLEAVVAPTATKAEEEAEDVYVRGKAPPRDVTVRTLTQEEMSRIPGTNGDAIRALLNLPGVGRPPGLAGLLIVRGSAPQDTQTFVDGTQIPLVYHFGGLSSVVPTEMLEKIDFYPGNFSTRYGRGMGGIVDVGLADPKSDKIHALAQVDLIDGRLMVQGPIADGWRFSLAGRRSWVDLWLKPVLEQTGAGVSAAPVYYDYQALIGKTWDKGRQDFRLALFGSDDRLAILISDVNASAPTLAGGISAHTGFWRAQMRYRNRFNDKLELRATLATGQDFFDINVGTLSLNVLGEPTSARIELASKFAREATMNLGVDVLVTPYHVSAVLPPPPTPGQPPGGPFLSQPPVSEDTYGAGYRPGFYDELELTPWKGTRIVPGIRLDYASDTKKWDVAPRVLVRQDLTTGFPRTTVKAAAGIYYQPPQFQESDPVFGQPGVVSDRAIEYDLGLEQEITRYVDVSFDGFYKALDQLIVSGNMNNGTGKAYGLETLLKWRPDGRFFGWLAYTLSRSVRQDGPGLPEYPSTFDQTHILTILGSYRIGHGWQVGARFRLVSGNPYTPDRYGFYDENNASYLPQSSYPINGQRLPPFHQLDVRLDKTWTFPKWQFSLYLDLQNVYNQGNVEGTSANYNYTLTQYTTGLPFLPSFGLRAEF
jgi:TonB family protein